MSVHADFAVVGAGIVGLSVARQLAIEQPRAHVVVFDKEEHLAAHASGRNSGVLHAGFYYSPDSLKARLTRRGNRLLHEFCEQHEIPVRNCGKVVVASGPQELERLTELARRAVANDVPVDLITPDRLAELEPLARTHEQALWSPSTSVADPAAVVHGVARDAERRGVHLMLRQPVLAAEPGRLLTPVGSFSVGHIVNCAGLHADRVAGWFGMCDDYTVLPFKGTYRYLDWAPGTQQRHVYPVPDPLFPFLGVHATVTVAGRTKIGPTAIPVPSRENYRRLQGIDWHDLAPTALGLARFLAHRPRDSAPLVRAELRKYRTASLVADAARLVPAIRPSAVAGTGRPGIRAQLVNTRTGELEMDFVVRGDDRSTHVLNAVSPAWTSALATAEFVVAGILGGGSQSGGPAGPIGG